MNNDLRSGPTKTTPISAERWKQLEPLIDAALDVALEDRRAFLRDACAGDAALQADAELLLGFHDRRDTLFDGPVAERFGDLFDNRVASVPTVLAGKYRIERELGRGGMATVYLAWDLRHERHVAVKVLHPHIAAALGIERFLTEIKTTARLQDPHILALYDSGEADGFVFYVMPYIEGGSLRRRLEHEKQLPLDEAIRIACEVASAITAAHREGVIHRDVKPENILLHNGTALVADFGIALAVSAATAPRLTAPGSHLGTPEYMSPEQATENSPIDARSDIYALGTVLYEMLAGETPFTGVSATTIIAKRAATSASSVRILRHPVPASLDATVARALAREPADRFATVTEFAQSLRHAAAQLDSGDTQARAPLRSFGRNLRLSLILLAVLVMTAVVAIVARWRQVTTTRNAVVASDSLSSIAVLPLAIVGNDTSIAYFADGVTDELSIGLGNVRGIRLVPGRSAAFLSRAKDPDFKDLGRKLGVALLLAGRVRREGTRLRLAIDLIRTRDGSTQWTNAYSAEDGNLSDIFRVRDSIVKDIVGELRLTLNGAQMLALPRRPTENLEAYSLYLQGRYQFDQRRPDRLDRALLYFQQAIARDSNFAEAHSAVADVYSTYAIGSFGDYPPTEYFPKARAAARRALELDKTSGDAHASLAVVYLLYDLDWEGAQREFTLALALNPRSTIARTFHMTLLEYTGRFDEAAAEVRDAVQIDPLSLFVLSQAARALFFQRNYDGAAVELRRVLDRDSTQPGAHMLLGQVLEAQKQFDLAVGEMKLAVQFSPNSSRMMAYLAHALALAGRTTEALHELGTLQQRARSAYVPSFNFAIVYAGLGRKDQTFAWLEKSLSDHSIRPFLMDPTFDPVRSDPRYASLLEKMHLPLPNTRH
jgi:serine/threonine-protein kinase